MMRALLLLSLFAAVQAEWLVAPGGGRSMLPADPISVMRLPAGSMARSEIIPVEGMPFSRAARVNVSSMPRQAWDVQVLATTTDDIHAGDVILISLFVRGSSANETGEAYGVAYLQKRGGNNDKLGSVAVSGGGEWRQFMAPFTAQMTLPAGQHEFTLFLGYGLQTMEVGGLSLVNYGTTRPASTLPRSSLQWAGIDAEAPWRKEAAETIEIIRKSDIDVTVLDSAGNAVEGAEVRVRQRKHEFGFGSAVAADGLFAQGPDGDRYRAVVRGFNKVVLENDLKWPNWEANRSKALNALAWLRENGVNQVRGHTLVWPGWSRMPADVQKLAGDPEALRRRVLGHIEDELGATRGQLVEWDVVNEPYTNTDLQKVLGEEEMAEWFKKARAIEPSAVLYINDYSILSSNGLDRAHQDHYFNTIRKLIDQGAPIGGIGMQSHFGSQLTPPARVWQILDRFAGFGKHIHITEFDVDIQDEAAQAAYTRDFMTATFAHPSVTGFMMWGFWEGRHWKPGAAMWRKDWTLKPNGEVFYDLVFNQWWTDVRGTTDAAGSYKVRGFKGEYDIEVTAGGKTATRPLTLDWRPAAVTVTLE